MQSFLFQRSEDFNAEMTAIFSCFREIFLLWQFGTENQTVGGGFDIDALIGLID